MLSSTDSAYTSPDHSAVLHNIGLPSNVFYRLEHHIIAHHIVGLHNIQLCSLEVLAGSTNSTTFDSEISDFTA